jgi:hypothetical protein
MMEHAYNPSTQEAEARGWSSRSEWTKHSQILSQKIKDCKHDSNCRVPAHQSVQP